MPGLIILAHPSPKSFNASLARAAQRTLQTVYGEEPDLLDLTVEKFDPVERAEHYSVDFEEGAFPVQAAQRQAADADTLPDDIERHLEFLERADYVIFQFPMWRYQPPAILKGWLDRVLVYGRAYTSRRRYDTCPFQGKRAMLSVTTGAPAATFTPSGRNGDIDLLLWPLMFTLHYVGFTVLRPSVIFGVEAGLSYRGKDEVSRDLAQAHADFVQKMQRFPAREAIPFNGWSDWDETRRLLPNAPSHSVFMRHSK